MSINLNFTTVNSLSTSFPPSSDAKIHTKVSNDFLIVRVNDLAIDRTTLIAMTGEKCFDYLFFRVEEKRNEALRY